MNVTGEILIDIDGPLAIVTLSRPDKLNAVTYEMLLSFEEAIDKLVDNPNVRIIIFKGAGDRAFSAGFDLKMIESLKGKAHSEFFLKLESIIRKLATAKSCVTIAAVRGYVIGFGAMVALACDLRFFSTNAIFRLPEINISIFPGAGAAVGLIKLVGPSRAKDILLSGRKVSAQEAYAFGIADRLLEPESVVSVTQEYAMELASKDSTILLDTKKLVDQMYSREYHDADKREGFYLRKWLKEC
ncbi:MAG: hypothetical protein BAJATHORv1_40289 [Candidatus Thorarchaeota archaeon]|nr:MAG: hypothetical protein BAJATHORv1_40289 [Candidatus Thorarchaeota archaeon]